MIYYDEYGDKSKETILLLHGAMAVDTFTQQYELLQEFHVVVPHLYGAGESVAISYEPMRLKEELIELIQSFNKQKIIIMGHSIGAQLAVALVAEKPDLFTRAVFLSPWIIPNERSSQMYGKLAAITVKLLHFNWMIKIQAKYWHYTKKQTDYMIRYSQKITVENYRAFFKETLNIEDFPQYFDVQIPMLAICGSRESKDIKQSIERLGKNLSCQTIVLQKAGHDFPMRRAAQLNPIIKGFLKG